MKTKKFSIDTKYTKIFSAMILILLAVLLINPSVSLAKNDTGKETPVKKTKWQKLLDKYRYSKNVNQIMFVKYKGGSRATFYMYTKTKDHKWKRRIKCKAYVGYNGVSKKKNKYRDDGKTPLGNYKLTWAFGIKKDPGTKLKYYKVKDYHYLCADPSYYNKLININKKPHYCSGEHLIDYGKAYYYGAMFDYNKECEYEQDYAIFLHCFSGRQSTGGCISIAKKNMKKALKLAEPGTRICIYKK